MFVVGGEISRIVVVVIFVVLVGHALVLCVWKDVCMVCWCCKKGKISSLKCASLDEMICFVSMTYK